MDAFTLMVAGALAGAIMAGGMGLQFLGGSRQACLVDWSLAGLLFACHGVLGAFTLPGQGGTALVAALGGACCVAGHGGVLAGVRRQLGLASGWKWLGLLAALELVFQLLAAGMLPSGPALARARLLLPLPAISALGLAAAFTICRHAREDMRAAFLPVGALQLVSALAACACAGLLGGGLSPALALTAGALSTLVFTCVALTACGLVVTRQQELALRRAGLTDAMTGWLNRRALHDVAWRAFRHCQRMREAAFFITFDIDHFKAVNERYGHGVGDAAIRHVAAVADEVAPRCDDRFRIGDKTFAVLVTGATPLDACRIAERLRELVALSPLDVDGEALALTVSVGVAALAAGDVQWQDILRRADQALCYAKQQGRNRVSALGIDCAGQAGLLPLWMAPA